MPFAWNPAAICEQHCRCSSDELQMLLMSWLANVSGANLASIDLQVGEIVTAKPLGGSISATRSEIVLAELAPPSIMSLREKRRLRCFASCDPSIIFHRSPVGQAYPQRDFEGDATLQIAFPRICVLFRR